MIFRLLRQYFRDDEFEANKAQLAESKALLTEYRDFIQDQKSASEEEKKKVDPDFLVMIWASIGLALTLSVEAVSNIPKIDSNSIKGLGLTEVIWLVIALYTVFYVVYNGIFAMSLTLDYAKRKDNHGYRYFAITLISGIILIFIGLVVIVQFGIR